MKLLETDLTKFISKTEITTSQKDIGLSMIMDEFMRNPDFDIKIENKLIGEIGLITILLKDKRN